MGDAEDTEFDDWAEPAGPGSVFEERLSAQSATTRPVSRLPSGHARVQSEAVGDPQEPTAPVMSEYEVRYRETSDRPAPLMDSDTADSLTEGCAELSRVAWELSSKAAQKCSEWPVLAMLVRDAAAALRGISEAGPEGLMDADRDCRRMMPGFSYTMPTLQEDSMAASVLVGRRQVWSAMGVPVEVPYRLPLLSPAARIGLLWFTVWVADSVVPRRTRSASPALRSGRESFGFEVPRSDPRVWAMVMRSVPCFRNAPLLDLSIAALGPSWKEWSENVLSVMLGEVSGVMQAEPFWADPLVSPSRTWSAVLSRAAEYDKEVHSALSRVF